MGKSSISYKQNKIDFKEAVSFFMKEASEASSINLFNPLNRGYFRDVIDIEEFDNGEYLFRLKNEEFFVVEGKIKHGSC